MLTPDETLAWPVWDLDAIACERHHLDERRAAVLLDLEPACHALLTDGYAPEVRRGVMRATKDAWRVLDHLREMRRELRGRAAHH